jgi:hypothetical protein
MDKFLQFLQDKLNKFSELDKVLRNDIFDLIPQDKDAITYIKTYMEEKPFAKGGVGEVYNMKSPYDKYVTKVVHGSDLKINRIPDTLSGKTIAQGTPLVVETVASAILSENLSSYTNAFTKTIGYLYEKDTMYLLTEKLQPIFPILQTPYHCKKNTIYTLFQIIHGICIAQHLYKYTHFDLHAENILSRPISDSEVHVYELGNGQYLYTQFDFETVIIDYGYNRFETSDTIFQSTQEKRDKSGMLGLDNYEFNPYLDVFSILHGVLSKIKDKTPGISDDIKRCITQICYLYLHYFFKLGNDGIPEKINSIINDLYEKRTYWIGNPHMLTQMQPLSALQMLQIIPHILNEFPEYVASIQEINKDPKLFPVILKVNNILVFDRMMDKIDGCTVHIHSLPPNKLYPVSLPYEVSPKGTWNIENINITYKQNGDEQFYIATILPSQNFTYRFDCCKTDVRNYLQTTDITNGMVVSSRKTNIFKNAKVFIDDKKPEPLEKVACIDRKGQLVLDGNRFNYNDYMSIGPVFIENNEVKLPPTFFRREKCILFGINKENNRVLIYADATLNSIYELHKMLGLHTLIFLDIGKHCQMAWKINNQSVIYLANNVYPHNSKYVLSYVR